MTLCVKKMENEKGASLIEVILVVLTLGFIVILMAALPNALGLIAKSRHVGIAREIAAKQIEDKRAVSFINLVNGTTTISDSRLSLLPEAIGQVEVLNCDPQICFNSEPIKTIKVTVNWKELSKTQTVSWETFIGEGGLNQ